MKHCWINRQNNETLLVFFNGWGMDAKPFAHLDSKDVDVLMFYDYKDFTIEESIPAYPQMHLAAWSLGVWAYAASGFQLPFSTVTAYNGTLDPVDEQDGIDPMIFLSTLKNWNEAARMKFYRRISGGGDFPMPDRAIEDQQEELLVISRLAGNGAKADFTHAVIGENDRIFSCPAQLNSWNKRQVRIKLLQSPHYPFGDFHTWKELFTHEN